MLARPVWKQMNLPCNCMVKLGWEGLWSQTGRGCTVRCWEAVWDGPPAVTQPCPQRPQRGLVAEVDFPMLKALQGLAWLLRLSGKACVELQHPASPQEPVREEKASVLACPRASVGLS